MRQQGRLTGSLLASGAFSFVLLAGSAFGPLPWTIPLVYAVMSIVAFTAYALDKRAAQAGQWRTGEGALILLGLLGGWPGALIAQEMFRHKTRKQPFRAVFWASVALNIAAVVWFASVRLEGVI